MKCLVYVVDDDDEESVTDCFTEVHFVNRGVCSVSLQS